VTEFDCQKIQISTYEIQLNFGIRQTQQKTAGQYSVTSKTFASTHTNGNGKEGAVVTVAT